MAKRPKRFTLTFDMGNAAFDDDAMPEVVRILDAVKSRYENGEVSGGIMDVNGNTVGSFKTT